MTKLFQNSVCIVTGEHNNNNSEEDCGILTMLNFIQYNLLINFLGTTSQIFQRVYKSYCMGLLHRELLSEMISSSLITYNDTKLLHWHFFQFLLD